MDVVLGLLKSFFEVRQPVLRLVQCLDGVAIARFFVGRRLGLHQQPSSFLQFLALLFAYLAGDGQP